MQMDTLNKRKQEGGKDGADLKIYFINTLDFAGIEDGQALMKLSGHAKV